VADTGGRINLSTGTYHNTGGTLLVYDNSTMSISAGVEIIGGTLNTDGTGIINATSCTFTSIANEGLVSGTDFLIQHSLSNNGTIHLTSGSLDIPENVLLNGTGTIEGNLSNAGRFALSHNGIGADIQGDYTQDDTGILLVPVSSQGAAELIVTGTANLSGSLRIVPTEGYIPAAGEQVTILTAGSVTGSFDLDILGPCGISVDYTATQVIITFVQEPDFPDFDDDSKATILDMVIQMGLNGSCPSCPEDLDCNAFIDTDDILMCIPNWLSNADL